MNECGLVVKCGVCESSRAEVGCVRRETVVNDRTGVEVGEESGETERSEVGKASRLNVLVQQG